MSKVAGAVAVAAGVFLLSRRAGSPEKSAGADSDPGLDLHDLTYSRGELEALATSIAMQRGCPPVVLLATVDVESAWVVRAQNMTGGDGQRGGAFGLAQMTYQTGVAVERSHPTTWSHDPTLPASGLLVPSVNLALAASLHADNAAACGGSYMSNVWLSDLAALYNSGKLYDRAPVSTRTSYVSKFLAAVSRRSQVA